MKGFIDLDYLAPPRDEVAKIVHSSDYIKNGEKESAIRKIFYNVPFTDFEQKKIAELEAHLKKNKIKTPAFWNHSMNLRFGYSCRFDLEKTTQRLTEFFRWREFQENGSLSKNEFKFIDDGVIYLAGRDYNWRPVIILDLAKIDKNTNNKELTQAISTFMCLIEKYCFVPGKIENWIYIIDTANKGVLDFPVEFIKSVLAAIAAYFPSTLEKLYILDPSFSLKYGWKTIEIFIDERTSKKIQFLDKDDYKKMNDFIPEENIQERYGGTSPDIVIYWPPDINYKPDIMIEDEDEEDEYGEEGDNEEDDEEEVRDSVADFEQEPVSFGNSKNDKYKRNNAPESPLSDHRSVKSQKNNVFSNQSFEKPINNPSFKSDKSKKQTVENFELNASMRSEKSRKSSAEQALNRSIQSVEKGNNRYQKNLNESFDFQNQSQPTFQKKAKPAKVNHRVEDEDYEEILSMRASSTNSKKQKIFEEPVQTPAKQKITESQVLNKFMQQSITSNRSLSKQQLQKKGESEEEDDQVVQQTPVKSNKGKPGKNVKTLNTEESTQPNKGKTNLKFQTSPQNGHNNKKHQTITVYKDVDEDDLNSLGIPEILKEMPDLYSQRIDTEIPDEFDVEDEPIQERFTRGTSPVKTKALIDESTIPVRTTIDDVVGRYSTVTSKKNRNKTPIPEPERATAPVTTKKNIMQLNKMKYMIPHSDESDDDRDGMFCGVCVSRKKPKK